MVRKFNQYFDLRDTSTIRVIPDDLPGCENDGYLIFSDAQTVVKPKSNVTNDICICKCVEKSLVFAETTITADYKNDKTSLLFRKLASTDTVSIHLKNDLLNLDVTITDDTLGTYYSSFTSQPLQIGFICDWQKVLTTHGIGVYYFEISKIILGESEVITSVNYSLQEYSDELANGTVRIDSYQDGNIKNTNVIFKGLIPGGWFNSVRIQGRLMNKTPNFTQDNYYNQVDKLVQIRDTVQNEWLIETGLLRIEVADLLLENMFLANKIVVSDFNVYSEAQIKEIELAFNGLQEKKSFERNINSLYKFKMKQRFDNIIKYNY